MPDYIAKTVAPEQLIQAIQDTFDEYSKQLYTEVILATGRERVAEVNGKTLAMEEIQQKLHDKITKIIQA